MSSQLVSEQFLQILMYATMYVHGAHTNIFAFTGPHPTDQTEPAAVTCSQQTDSAGVNIQPVTVPAYCGDSTNQVSELRN